MERGSEWDTLCYVSMSLHGLGHICLGYTVSSAVFSGLSFWPFQNESPSELFMCFMLLEVILRCWCSLISLVITSIMKILCQFIP